MRLTRGNTQKLAAAVLVVCLQALMLPISNAADSATLSGTVFAEHPSSGLSGVIVHIADPTSQRIFSSSPSTTNGSFIVEDLPPGSYEIALESNGVLYTVGVPVVVSAGQDRMLNLKLDAHADLSGGVPASKVQGVWSSPLTATLLVVGAVVVIGLAADSGSSGDSDEGPSSPF